MSRNHHQFAKRQRELAKKKKKEEKRERKLGPQHGLTEEESARPESVAGEEKPSE